MIKALIMFDQLLILLIYTNTRSSVAGYVVINVARRIWDANHIPIQPTELPCPKIPRLVKHEFMHRVDGVCVNRHNL
jgi:hypothetical protein